MYVYNYLNYITLNKIYAQYPLNSENVCVGGELKRKCQNPGFNVS